MTSNPFEAGQAMVVIGAISAMAERLLNSPSSVDWAVMATMVAGDPIVPIAGEDDRDLFDL